MKIGLAYDLKSTIVVADDGPDDASEEYDPPGTIDALEREIENLGHRVFRLGGGVEFLEKIRDASVDLVFNIAEGRGTHRSREAQIPGILEMLGVPYAGSDPLTLALALDKPLTKRIAESHGIRTPRYVVVASRDGLSQVLDARLEFPLVAKPAFEGSSKGVRTTSLVDDWDGLQSVVENSLRMYRQPVLVEEFISGQEVTVGMAGSDHPVIVGMMEIVPRLIDPDRFIYSLEVKRDWERQVSYRCPPNLPESTLAEMETMSRRLFDVLGCRDMARIDFRIRKGVPYFLEINPLPGLSEEYSDLPIMARASGWRYSQLIETIVNSALARYGLLEAVDAHRAAL